MNTRFLSVLLLLSTGLFLSGCQTATTTGVNDSGSANAVQTPPAANAPATPAVGAPRISLADAKAAFDAGTAFFVDSRADSAFKDEHIKGAVNIAAGTVDANLKQLPKDKKIIVYCS